MASELPVTCDPFNDGTARCQARCPHYETENTTGIVWASCRLTGKETGHHRLCLPAAQTERAARVAAEGECERLRERVDALNGRLETHTDWYQQRFNRLRKWVKEEVAPLSADVATHYFSICANGAAVPHESGDWSDTMHAYKLKAEVAVTRLKAAEARYERLANFNAATRGAADTLDSPDAGAKGEVR